MVASPVRPSFRYGNNVANQPVIIDVAKRRVRMVVMVKKSLRLAGASLGAASLRVCWLSRAKAFPPVAGFLVSLVKGVNDDYAVVI